MKKLKTVLAIGLVILFALLIIYGFNLFLHNSDNKDIAGIAELMETEGKEETEEMASAEISSEEQEEIIASEEESAGTEPASEEFVETAVLSDQSRVEDLIKGQSLEKKISQLFICTPEALTGGENVLEAGETARRRFEEFPVSGIIYMGKNLKNPSQTKKMLSDMQSYSQSCLGLPLIQCVDEEGGTVSRIASNASYGVKDVGNMSDVGKSGDQTKAYESGKYIGSYLSELGFNLDFAPVADILTVSNNKLMEKRSFGSDKNLVSQMAVSLSKGLESEGVLSCAKHFPGHGNTVEDSHKGFAVSNKSMAELEETELQPFRAEMDSGISMIMVGHISLPEVTGDKTPSSLSPKIVEGILRKRMGYNGVVTTDAMNMGAVVNHYSNGEAAVLAIEAGCDIILAPDDLNLSRNALLQAVKSGRISEDRIDESLKRIYRLKLSLK